MCRMCLSCSRMRPITNSERRKHRWVSAAIVEAEKTFRRVQGWQDITKVVSALGDLEAKEGASTERVA